MSDGPGAEAGPDPLDQATAETLDLCTQSEARRVLRRRSDYEATEPYAVELAVALEHLLDLGRIRATIDTDGMWRAVEGLQREVDAAAYGRSHRGLLDLCWALGMLCGFLLWTIGAMCGVLLMLM
jgi:hypothetical protein